MNSAVLLTFLCSAVLLVAAQDSNAPPPSMINPTANATTGQDHDSKDGMNDHTTHDHSTHDHSTHDHSAHDHSNMMPSVTDMPSTSKNDTVKDPSAQGSMTGDAVTSTTCLSFVMIAATLPLLL